VRRQVETKSCSSSLLAPLAIVFLITASCSSVKSMPAGVTADGWRIASSVMVSP
jgi:hypothetical protein